MQKGEDDIGGGVILSSKEVEFHRAFTNSPAILSRKLMKLVFSTEELCTFSLYGSQSNANKNIPALPALSPKWLNAVIGI